MSEPGDPGAGGGEPGWRPDPWQPGGWRWHDGREWTSWTGPPPGPPPGHAAWPGAQAAPAFGRSAADEVASERRLLPWAAITMLLLAAAQFLGPLVVATALRDVLGDALEVAFDPDSTTADIEAALDDVRERQEEHAWLGLVGWLPLGLLAVLAVWTHRVATAGRRLGYPSRRSPGWAAAGWFVPVVNLWFPYQAIVDSLSPGSAERRLVLRWWLVWLAGGLVSTVSMIVIITGETTPVLAVAAPAALALAQAVLGVGVVTRLHEEHEAAVAGP